MAVLKWMLKLALFQLLLWLDLFGFSCFFCL